MSCRPDSSYSITVMETTSTEASPAAKTHLPIAQTTRAEGVVDVDVNLDVDVHVHKRQESGVEWSALGSRPPGDGNLFLFLFVGIYIQTTPVTSIAVISMIRHTERGPPIRMARKRPTIQA